MGPLPFHVQQAIFAVIAAVLGILGLVFAISAHSSGGTSGSVTSSTHTSVSTPASSTTKTMPTTTTSTKPTTTTTTSTDPTPTTSTTTTTTTTATTTPSEPNPPTTTSDVTVSSACRPGKTEYAFTIISELGTSGTYTLYQNVGNGTVKVYGPLPLKYEASENIFYGSGLFVPHDKNGTLFAAITTSDGKNYRTEDTPISKCG